jgi:hypothetical protein
MKASTATVVGAKAPGSSPPAPIVRSANPLRSRATPAGLTLPEAGKMFNFGKLQRSTASMLAA